MAYWQIACAPARSGPAARDSLGTILCRMKNIIMPWRVEKILGKNISHIAPLRVPTVFFQQFVQMPAG